MKFMMFAALAAAVAMPALAQTTPAPADAPMAQPAPMAPAAPAADPAAAQPMAAQAAPTDAAAPAAAAPMPASGSYPMCSRTVTDQCTERSNGKGERMHSTPRPHRK